MSESPFPKRVPSDTTANTTDVPLARAWRAMPWPDARRDILARLDVLSGEVLDIAATFFFVFRAGALRLGDCFANTESDADLRRRVRDSSHARNV